MTETLVSKSEFAARVNISPGRVSQLISEGKIRADAIRGDGRSAKLVLELALAQYRAGRAVGQALGNGAHARTFLPGAPDTASLLPVVEPATKASPTAAAAQMPVSDPVAERIQKERLEQERIKTERMRREEAMAEGRYMLAEDATAQMNQVAATVIRIFEGGLADLATAIAARFAVPQRDVMHELQKAFRDVRSRASAEHRSAAETMPETVAANEDAA